MLKKVTILLVLLMFIFSTVPAYASSDSHFSAKDSVVYKSDIVVTGAGGVYQVGFTTIKFPSGFISADKLPIKIHVEISSVDGVAGIEFTPDIPVFNADVTINVHSYNGLLYDETLRKNIPQNIKHQVLQVNHFSRYCFS